MKRHWRRIRRGWNRADTVLLVSNVVVLALFIGNAWWHALPVVYAAVLAALCAQGASAALRPGTMRTAWLFGLGAGASWPAAEWVMASTAGWWGQYLHSQAVILETPLYAALIGWLAATHACYIGLRAIEFGYSPGVGAVNAAFTGLGLGIVGENLFVAGGFWEYRPSAWRFWAVPAFIPVAYGAVLMLIPLVRRVPPVAAGVLFSALVLLASVALGFATGFFPQIP